jgi:flagellar protein FliO/FliZ
MALLFWALFLAGPVPAQEKTEVIHPRAAAHGPADPATRQDPGANSYLLFLALAAAAAGGWFLWHQRRARQGGGREARKLSLAETCPLGNRQYLVVADYNGSKFLLGVCPGRIDFLATLDEAGRPKTP